MKSRLLFAALSLPMIFAACTQDEYIDVMQPNAPLADGTNITFNFVKGAEGDAATRAEWDDALTFTEKDAISVYWLGGEEDKTLNSNVNAIFNSIFRTKDGAEFTSESLVYFGSNIAVFPANLNHYKANQDVYIEIDSVQTATTVKDVPYISNKLKIVDNDSKEQIPGYNNGLYAPMKQAANVVDLTLSLKNHTALMGNPYNLTIDKVVLEAKTTSGTNEVAANAFANKANLKYVAGVPTQQGKVYWEKTVGEETVEDSLATITQRVDLAPVAQMDKLTSTAITNNQDGTYKVRFVVLPTAVPVDSASVIKVYTNCGTVTLKSNYATYANYHIADSLAAKNNATTMPALGDAFTKKDGTKLAIAEVMNDFITMPVSETSADFKNEKVGKVVKRTIEVDMSKAELTGNEVTSSEDIIHYVNLYKALNKKGDMFLNMVDDATIKNDYDYKFNNTDKMFDGLTAAAVKALTDLNAAAQKQETPASVGLNVDSSIKCIEIVGGGAVYDIPVLNGNADIILQAGKSWTMNDSVNLDANITQILNYGTLTIAGTEDKDGNQNTVAETIKNEGTINLGGNGTVKMNANFAQGSIAKTEIAANQFLTFTGGITTGLNGTFDIKENGFLTIADGVEVHFACTINNAGTLASEGTVGGVYNEGTINVNNAAATTYVQDNSKGTIKMKNRTDEIKVESADQGNIVYTYTTSDSNVFAKSATDKFTAVVFGSDITSINMVDDKGVVSPNISDVDLTFNGTTTLNADDTKSVVLGDLTVAKGAHLKVNSYNAITVQNLYNNGTITVGGKISYDGVYTPGTGAKVLSVGGGSIVQSTVAQAALQNLITEAIEAQIADNNSQENPIQVSINRDYTLTEPLKFDGATTRAAGLDTIYVELNLNGKTINALADAIEVADGYVLTINGEGTVHAAVNNDESACAVWSTGGKVIINGGHYMVGNDGDLRNDCIYAKNAGSITINDGKFEYVGKTNVATDNEGNKFGHQFLVNCKDGSSSTITVNGGTFKNHVPGYEAVGTGEVSLGAGKAVYSGATAVTAAHSGTATKWYTVK